jgi:hypothetical protein
MSEGENKSLIFRTSREFLQEFRALDARIDGVYTRQQALMRARDARAAAKAAREHSRLCARMQDLIMDEIERHWGPMLLEDGASVPQLPDNWRIQFFGRVLRLDYRERAAYKGD